MKRASLNWLVPGLVGVVIVCVVVVWLWLRQEDDPSSLRFAVDSVAIVNALPYYRRGRRVLG